MLFEKIAESLLQDGIVLCRVESIEQGEGEPPPLAETDGIEVRVLARLSDADASWLGVHLAGHALQWASKPNARRWDLRKTGKNSTLSEVLAYEEQAGAYAMNALERVAQLQSWYWSRARADWRSYGAWLVSAGWSGEVPDMQERDPETCHCRPYFFPPGRAFEVPRY